MNMSDTAALQRMTAIIEADQTPAGPRAEAMARAITAQHAGKVKALLFYGSSLREGDQSGKMLDFYVLVDRYRDIYGSGLKRVLSAMAPPGVHYIETDGPDGERMRSKYAIMSTKAFMRRTSGGALESMLWARFSQPTRILCDDPALTEQLIKTCAAACQHFMSQTTPLLSGTLTPQDVWVRALTESYRAELRPENAPARARDIVTRQHERYTALSLAAFPEASADALTIPPASPSTRLYHKYKWFLRRVIGKPMGLFRVTKAFYTFDNGIDYIIEKLTSHSDVEIELTESERKRPLLNAPRVAWRLYRKGAFR